MAVQPQRVSASRDPNLSARVVRRRPLSYTEGPDPTEDRAPHVRSGSGLAWVGESLAVVQDDANFVALVEPRGDTVRAISLPRGAGGLRVFDDERGNKKHKLDLETCFSTTVDGDWVLMAFGSGSTRAREQVLEVRFPVGGAHPEVELHHAPAFYESLRNHTEFSGSELNVEGVTTIPDGGLRLFQRGNGAPRGELQPVDATAEVSGSLLFEHLQGSGPPPPIQNVVRYDLGTLGKVRLTFTDAIDIGEGRALFLATAEDSPDAIRDGAVLGSVIGLLNPLKPPRWAPLCNAQGEPLAVKGEGIVVSRTEPSRVFVVLDSDSPGTAAELMDVELLGPWRG
ncbi:MAG: hypothetical protein DRI90_01945 [Deltaproteobacteria bacterium]|nr:MAG: hypothetical protein DRI90_01945 [Deltaproteobacteria bacterium]